MNPVLTSVRVTRKTFNKQEEYTLSDRYIQLNAKSVWNKVFIRYVRSRNFFYLEEGGTTTISNPPQLFSSRHGLAGHNKGNYYKLYISSNEDRNRERPQKPTIRKEVSHKCNKDVYGTVVSHQNVPVTWSWVSIEWCRFRSALDEVPSNGNRRRGEWRRSFATLH